MIKKRLQVYQISTKCIIIQEIIEVRNKNDNLQCFDNNITYCDEIEIVNQNTLIAYLNYDIVRIYQLNEYYEVQDERPIK